MLALPTGKVLIQQLLTTTSAQGNHYAPQSQAEEQDMLDLAHEPRDGSSRLACQVVLTRNLLDQYVNDDENNSCNTSNKLVVTIPSGVNDVWK